MDIKQALDVVNQGINVAVGAGAFKNARDVAVLAQSIEVLANYFQAQDGAKEVSVRPSPEMTKESK